MSQHQSRGPTTNRHDPTRTKTLRNQYATQLRKRYRALKGLVWQGVAVDDRLGLKDHDPTKPGARSPLSGQAGEEGGPERPRPRPVPDATPLPPDITDRPYDFPDDEAKILFFDQWVEQAQDDLIASAREKPSEHWTSEYVGYSYERGLENARKHLEDRGINVPEPALRETFQMPIHKNTLSMLYTRNFRELNGITDEVGKQISRELVEGFLKGENPRVVARSINDRIDKIGITRAETLARTEIIRAHNEATLSRYESIMGSDVEVTVLAEFQTAGDRRVCEKCQSLEGRRFSLKEARGFIPANTHPNCRCAWVPVTRGNAPRNRPAAPGGGLGSEGWT